uniref:Cysteine and serine rich nuclear protein 1 n=1 Tax=Panthera tigris altaica TaxID=74533 RepID=A0A8C9JEJ0_PANTA
MTGPLKRKFDQLDEDSSSLCSFSSSLSSGRRSGSCSPSSSVSLAWDSDEESPWDQIPLPDRDFCGPRSFTPLSILKRAPRKRPGRVAFDGITVFYFPRCQGFTSVPSRGGCTLGMAPRHSACRRVSFAGVAPEQARRPPSVPHIPPLSHWIQLTEAGVPETEPPASSELGDDSCSSDMTDSSTASGSSEAPSGPPRPALPGPGFQPDMDDDSLARVLSFSDSDLGGEEEEEEEGGVGTLDNLSCFHPADIFGTGDPGGPASWTHSYSSSSLTSGILDENANLDASFFLNGGLEGLGEGSLLGTSVPPSSDAGQSNSVDLSLSSCDSFELLQALPDYSLGPHYTSRTLCDSLDNLEAPYFPLPAFSPPGDAGSCFLESVMGLPDSAAEALAPFIDSQLLEDTAPASLVEPVPV